MRFKASILALALSACLSAGCATVVGLPAPDDLYPSAITTCAGEPAVPARPAPGAARTEDAKAGYVADLHAWGADCSDTVAAVAARKAAYEAQYKKTAKR